MIYSARDAKELNPDIIYEPGDGKTYLCFLNPALVDWNSEVSIYSQNVWRIVRIEEITDHNEKIIETKYPNGHSQLYGYNINDLTNYNYEFQK